MDEVFDTPSRRTRQVRIVMTEDEKRRLDETAKALRMSVSDLIRTSVNEFVTKHHAEKSRKKSRTRG